MRMEFLKAVITPEFLLILDYRNVSLEHWLLNELASQLAGEGQLVTYSLPFEFRAIEAILQYWISKLQGRLNTLQPQILETLEALVDPKLLSVDRSKLHILLQNGKSLSELETDVKVFKETILEILDEEEVIEELCLSKWTDPQVFEESTSGIDHAEEMELLLENYYRQAEDLLNEARELRVLIDDSESIIFINLDSHRNVMMRLNLQLTMGTFSVSLFGLIGVAFGMNLESSLEEVRNECCIYDKIWVLLLQHILYLVQPHSFHRQSSSDLCVHTVTSFLSKLLYGKLHSIAAFFLC